MPKAIPRVTRSQLRKVAIVGCHLHQFEGKGKIGIRNLIREQGLIQLDPLNPAGRNHDIFCFSRLNTYSQGAFEEVLYPESLVFENYFHALNVISRDFLPLFYSLRNYENAGSYYQKRLDNLKNKHPELLDQVFSFIKSHGPVSSGDLVHFGKATPDMKIWKSSSKAGSALEFLWVLGKLAIVKRDHLFKKYYDLIERRFDSKLLQSYSLSPQELAYAQLQLRIRSFPLLNAKFTITKSGTLGAPRSKHTWFQRMNLRIEDFFEDSPLNFPDIIWGTPKLPVLHPKLVFCPETNRIYFIRHDWQDLLEKELDASMRAIAPLDPLVYNRDETLALFDFEYMWEVYKPIKDRRWGYYVYPILWKGEIVGRWEVNFDKKAKILRFFNFQPENKSPSQKTPAFQKAMSELILKWKMMIGAETVEYDNTIPIKH